MQKDQDPLGRKIGERIVAGGPITFREFMRMALYEPGLGYYTGPGTQIGKAGDFYTSPHLHPAFGQMIAKQIEEMWTVLGKGPFAVIEQGPGKGYLAKDILDHIEAKNGELYDAVTYRLIELNPALESFQDELLDRHQKNKKVFRDTRLGETKEEKGMILANELLDAFPVHLVQMRGDELMEVYAGFDAGKGLFPFYETLAPPSIPEIEEYIREFVPGGRLPDGYKTEVNLDVRGWLREAGGVFKEGFILVIDYGYPAWDYYGPERDRGTLLCYKGHRVSEDPYREPGRMDITAHVNFSALARWGEREGFRCAGFCPQGTYLVSLGMEDILEGLGQQDILRIKGLLLPGTMGQTHKVMALYKSDLIRAGGPGGAGELPKLRGFEMRNQCKVL